MQEEKWQGVPKTFLVQLLETHDDHTTKETQITKSGWFLTSSLPHSSETALVSNNNRDAFSYEHTVGDRFRCFSPKSTRQVLTLVKLCWWYRMSCIACKLKLSSTFVKGQYRRCTAATSSINWSICNKNVFNNILLLCMQTVQLLFEDLNSSALRFILRGYNH
jgi:hypothetical protein